jgi:UPF0271 protein
MVISAAEAYDIVIYQIGAIAAFAQAFGGKLAHVKAHGALYTMAAKDRKLAEALAQAVRDYDRNLIFYALAGSAMIDAAEAIGLTTAGEVFADRTYQDDGTLTPRGQPNAMIEDEDASIAQVMRMVLEGTVRSVNGKDVRVRADTLCIHGDQPHALAFAKRIRAELARAGVDVKALSHT